MNRQKRRLSLSKETLRAMNDRELQSVGGAGKSTDPDLICAETRATCDGMKSCPNGTICIGTAYVTGYVYANALYWKP
jgi:hypothetical protein